MEEDAAVAAGGGNRSGSGSRRGYLRLQSAVPTALLVVVGLSALVYHHMAPLLRVQMLAVDVAMGEQVAESAGWGWGSGSDKLQFFEDLVRTWILYR